MQGSWALLFCTGQCHLCKAYLAKNESLSSTLLQNGTIWGAGIEGWGNRGARVIKQRRWDSNQTKVVVAATGNKPVELLIQGGYAKRFTCLK